KVLTNITDMKDTELIISKVPLTVKCRDCENISILDEPFFFCHSCESANVEILTGTELKVIEIELND
ncbi:MAG: hydrogenase maturation nickel metallochaperone HypA, partial [Bacteroidetes bacterium]|nr:hydrogenase maturation nickel metallochaperone HypA [Bacteroidota bacterium]